MRDADLSEAIGRIVEAQFPGAVHRIGSPPKRAYLLRLAFTGEEVSPGLLLLALVQALLFLGAGLFVWIAGAIVTVLQNSG